MGVAALVVVGVGILCILCALGITLDEYRSVRRNAKEAGVSESLAAVKDLLVAISDKGPAVLLFGVGLALLIIGGVMGGVSGL